MVFPGRTPRTALAFPYQIDSQRLISNSSPASISSICSFLKAVSASNVIFYLGQDHNHPPPPYAEYLYVQYDSVCI